jgi:hypothetical protein
MIGTQICSLCDSPERTHIDKMIADGATAAMVLLYMQSKGLEPVHRNTVSHHKVKHVRAVVVQRVQRTVQTARKLGERPPPGLTRDMAVLVRDRGIERLEAGDLDVTIAEALRAQEMIDRRMEKSGDREIVIGFLEALGAFVEPIGESFATRPRIVSPAEVEELPEGIIEWVEPSE